MATNLSPWHPAIRYFTFIGEYSTDGRGFWWLFNRIGDWVPQLMSYIPSWLQWLSYLLWPLMVISLLLVFSYLFSTLANIIAAPFNGLLAEQLEASLTGKPYPIQGAGDRQRFTPYHGARMAQIGLLLATSARVVTALFCPWRWPNSGTSIMVPVQCLDAINPIL